MDIFDRAIARVLLVIAQWTTPNALLAAGYVFIPLAAAVWLLVSYRQTLRALWQTLQTEPDKPIGPKWVSVCGIVGLVLFLGLSSCIIYFGFLVQPTDALYVGLVVLGAVGGLVAFLELSRNARVQKARFLKELYSEFFNDPGIRAAYYEIEHNSLSVGEERPDAERQLDRLLAFTDLVCELRARGSIADDDMRVFDYEFQRVFSSPGVRKYVARIRGFRGHISQLELPPDKWPFASFFETVPKIVES